MVEEPMTKSIAVSGGKGGVGKTLIATNLASYLAKQGKRTLLIDADFGMANANILFGKNTNRSINGLVNGEQSIEEVILNVAPQLDLIPGGTGENELLNLGPTARGNLLRNIYSQSRDYDYCIVDTSAGASDASLDFCAACDQLLVVIVGEPTSFMDAYSLIKAAHLDYKLDNFGIIVNQAASREQGQQLYKKFGEITKKFITVNQRYIGYLPHTSALKHSVISRNPIIQQKNSGIEYHAFSEICSEIDHLAVNNFSGLTL